MECQVPSSNIKIESPTDDSNVLVSVSGLYETEVSMLCREKNNNPNTDHQTFDTETKINLICVQKAQ